MITSEQFLSTHPDIAVGREALELAEADEGDTFCIVNKPLGNIVLYQWFNADTKKREKAVALVDDEKAEAYYKKYNKDGDALDEIDGGRCNAAEEQGANHKVFDEVLADHGECENGAECNQDGTCSGFLYRSNNCE